ncbi:hypothetical protein Patl1_29031 [Pistacia atlantica]|uniref:Uncharacterized protein n=1 Tax=Pistacia atlantica TaxID=434234 RepID=A0ACC1BCZ0_9ROSI|nr:hypothetical protein Patl1_29031 [Pistacia atlantica]
MFQLNEIPSFSSVVSTYASVAASALLFRSIAKDLLPNEVREFAISKLRHIFQLRSNEITVVIEEMDGIKWNEIFEASEVYLATKLSSNTQRIKVMKAVNEKHVSVHLEKNETIVDHYEGAELRWKYVVITPDKISHPMGRPPRFDCRSFELTFQKRHKDLVMGSYLPYVLRKAEDIADHHRVLKMSTLNNSQPNQCLSWESVNLEHPSTFETLAMDPKLKNKIIEDLNRFIRRKDFYKRVGRAWKRGYLLYGPPGTGKSSLVAAMANYLKFDVYDLQLANVTSDNDLRQLLLATGNKSILVIEDIDCSVDLPERRYHEDDDEQPDEKRPEGRKRGRAAGREENFDAVSRPQRNSWVTLSGLLNFIDGLWSSCGDQRIIIFTTNNKERLDRALLRPGRMDKHIHMSYCTFAGFKILASNYLGISDEHHLYPEIKYFIKRVKITPAQVAEELMKDEDPDVALEGFLKTLFKKQSKEVFYESDEEAEEDEEEEEVSTSNESKRQKTDAVRRAVEGNGKARTQ